MPTVVVPCPPGFDFCATASVLRRGAVDPLVWFDGRRWRRRLAVDGAAFLVEVRCAGSDRGGADAAKVPAPSAPHLSARLLAGRIPRPALARVIARVFGLDDPAHGITRHVPGSLRRLITQRTGTAALPGYPTLFEALVHTILGQQISAAAANIHRAAFAIRFGGPFAFRGRTYWTFPETAAIAAARTASLRRAGLSTAKAVAVREIARAFETGTISEASLAPMPADAAIEALTRLPGIGRWTAEWVVLRALRRFDIVPAGDLAVRKAVTWFAGARALLPEAAVRDVTASWAPYGGLIAFRLLLAHRRAIG